MSGHLDREQLSLSPLCPFYMAKEAALQLLWTFHYKLEALHREPVCEHPSPETDVVTIIGCNSFGIRRIDSGVIGHCLHAAIRGWRVGCSPLLSCKKTSQNLGRSVAFFDVSEKVVVTAAKRAMISRTARRIDNQQNNASQRRRNYQPCRVYRKNIGHKSNSARSEKHLQAGEKAVKAPAPLPSPAVAQSAGSNATSK